jgi:ribose transport system permease protein
MVATAILFVTIWANSSSFLSRYAVFGYAQDTSLYVLIAMAQAVCLVVGGMNLSVGGIGSLATVALGLCLDPDWWNLPVWAAVPIVLSVGLACGLLNGLLIVKLKINSFIVTISTMFIFMGLRNGIARGNRYSVPAGMYEFGKAGLFDYVPYIFLIMLAVLIAISYMYRHTVFGRRMLATGGNEDAARLSGIRTGGMILGANVLSGMLASLAAILYAMKTGSAAPKTGDEWLLYSFAVAIIGGTGLNGGIISGLGILMGGIIYVLIQSGLIIMNFNDKYMHVYVGCLIFLAIALDRAREVYGQRISGRTTRWVLLGLGTVTVAAMVVIGVSRAGKSPTTQPATQPAAAPAGQAATVPATRPVVQKPVTPATQPATQPAVQPETRPTPTQTGPSQ